MLISQWIDKLTGQQRMVEDLTKKIVARCEPAVWSRVRATAETMDPAQSRGYIRARASDIVSREVTSVVQTLEESTESLVERVTRSVSDTLVRKMMATLATQHPSALRRAA